MNGINAGKGDLAIHRGAATVSGMHELVWVEGDDTVDFLDGMLSQHVAAMSAGDVARSFFLSPRGKLQALLWVLRGDGRCGLVTDAGRGRTVADGLRRFLIRVRADVSEPQPLLELWGPRAEAVLAAAGAATTAGWSRKGGILTARLPGRVHDRWLIDGVEEGTLGARGASAAGDSAVTSARIEAGEPVMGVDVDEGTIPQETGLVGEAVSFRKGCYLGQELVARIQSRGRVHRMLVGMIVDGDAVPEAGAHVQREGRPVGAATSVGRSFRLGAPVAMGLLKTAAGPGTRVKLQWNGAAAEATVTGLPPAASLAIPPA